MTTEPSAAERREAMCVCCCRPRADHRRDGMCEMPSYFVANVPPASPSTGVGAGEVAVYLPCDLHVVFSKWCGHCLEVNGLRGPEDTTAPKPASEDGAAFQLGDTVEKVSGASWRGKIVGTYATALTPEGYAVESDGEPGSVQIYPAKALRRAVLAPAEQPVEVAAQEAVSDAVHGALWKADAEIARLRDALEPFAAIAQGEAYAKFVAESRMTFRLTNGDGSRFLTFINAECFDAARAALSLDANGGGL